MKLLPPPRGRIALLPGPVPDELIPLPDGAEDSIMFDPGPSAPPDFKLDFQCPGIGRSNGKLLFTTDSDVPRLYKLTTLGAFDGVIWSPGQQRASLTGWQQDQMMIRIQTLISPMLPVPGFGWSDSALAVPLEDGSIKVPGETQPYTEYKIRFDNKDPDPDEAKRCPLVPPSIPFPASPQMRNLAAQFKLAFDNPWDMTKGIIEWLQDECSYSLKAPNLPGNPIETFLFKTKQGICQHFAGATVGLLNLAGQEARVVVGYASSQSKPQEIMSGGAHAWIEVLFPGLGWVEFDPTGNANNLDDADPDRDVDDPGPDPLDPGDLKEMEEQLKDLAEDPPAPVVPYFERYLDAEIISWARTLGRQLARLMGEAARPRARGAYETGTGINSAQLYRLSYGDDRVYTRRRRAIKVPPEILLAHDESPSIKTFRDSHELVWKRVRFMMSEALGYASQDFAIFGFHSNVHMYKGLRQPYNDRVRGALVHVANDRIAKGHSTQTAEAIQVMRLEHEKYPAVIRHGIVVTDGAPSGPNEKVREEVELSHSKGLHITGVVLLNPKGNVTLQQLDAMFDRVLVLSGNVKEAADQLHTLLTKVLTS